MHRIRKIRRNKNKKANDYLNNQGKAPMVGTQAKAFENMERNRKDFNYPKENFITPIEHSLIYSMINEGPKVYPEHVVLNHIQEEDFTIYMPIQRQTESTLEVSERDEEDEMDDLATYTCSYAQLSAILALAGEKFKPHKGSDKPNSIPQKLCNKILNCVIAYSKRFELDREAEIKELLTPVEARLVKTVADKELRNVVPFYLGYAASMVTLNPLPMLIGFAVMNNNAGEGDNLNRNLDQITKTTKRRADEEQTSLLEEPEDF